MIISMKIHSAYRSLVKYLQGAQQVVVAFSGGVDSALLTYLVHQELGDKMTAITVKTPYTPEWEIEDAQLFAQEHHIRHDVRELPIPSTILQNPPERCYLCKREIFREILSRAQELGGAVVMEGSNKDDLQDYRPGMRVLKELNIESPMLQLGITKEVIRGLSRELQLKTWNKPSCACLLSRIPYHTEITTEELSRVAKAEQVLRGLNIMGSRVRSHGDIARIEVPAEQFADLFSFELRTQLIQKIQEIGYLYVVVDLEGYQTGSLNKTLSSPKKL